MDGRAQSPKAIMRRIPESTWRELRAAYCAGASLRGLARQSGIPAGSLLSRAHREQWSKGAGAAKTLALQTQRSAPDVSTAAAATIGERGQRHVERMAGIVERGTGHVERMEPDTILDRADDVDRLDRIARRTFGLDGRDQAMGMVNIMLVKMELLQETPADAREV